MFIIIGIVVVLGCIITGFLMINGPLGVLIQPSEFVVIGGAAIGATLAANPIKLLMSTLGKVMAALKGSPYTKAAYFELLQMQYDVYVNLKERRRLVTRRRCQQSDVFRNLYEISGIYRKPSCGRLLL